MTGLRSFFSSGWLSKWFSIAIGVAFLSPAVSGAEDVTGGFQTSDGLYRSYLVHLPVSYDEATPVPLVINLHWGGGTPQGQASFSGMNEKSDSAGFIVCYPEGTMMSYGWLGWNSSSCLESDVDDVSFISELIDTLEANYRIDSSMIFATGFCNGAMMVHKLACELSDRIAAFAPVAAGLTQDNWSGCQPSRPVSIMHIHARNDPSVPYYGGWYYDCYWPAVDSFMNFWAKELACDNGPDTTFNEEGALMQRWWRSDDSAELILWTTPDGSHYWPGSPNGSKTIDGNDVIWNFFVAHPMVYEPAAVDEPSSSSPSSRRILIDPLNSEFSGGTVSVSFWLETGEEVSLALYDATGRILTVMMGGVLDAGRHEVVMDVADFPRGVYFCLLSTPHGSQTQKILVVK